MELLCNTSCAFAIFAPDVKVNYLWFFGKPVLTGSLTLPLGDFSLLRDISKMCQNYTKIISEAEMGVIDFIGDYLFYGKQIFGHNEHDEIPVACITSSD
jgi:hypothetical protein